jgi:hypothetical protein
MKDKGRFCFVVVVNFFHSGDVHKRQAPEVLERRREFFFSLSELQHGEPGGVDAYLVVVPGRAVNHEADVVVGVEHH